MKLTNFANGSVSYRPLQPGREASETSTVSGNVTVNVVNAELDPAPPCFRVTFFIGFSHGTVGPDESDFLNLTVQVPAESVDQSYMQIEEAAARQVPAALRALADAVEKDIARTDQDRVEKPE